jgi:hypothetical protein
VRVNIYLFFSLVLILSKNANGQILIGPTLGGQYSWTTLANKDLKSAYKVNPVFGYHAGLGLSFRVRNRFFLTSSILYSTKGKVIKGKFDEMLREDVVYKFIDIPIIYSVDFRVRIPGDNQFKVFLGIGPTISYWLGGKGTLYNKDFYENSVPEMKFKIVFGRDENDVRDNEMVVQEANRIQLGLNLAAGIAFEPLPNQKLMFMTRYEFGHSYFSRDYNGHFLGTYYQDELRSRNQGWRLSLFYLVDTKTGERKKGRSTSHIRPRKRK